MDIVLMKVNPGLFSKTTHCWKKQSLFGDTKINVTTEGKTHLGALIGSNDFRIKYVDEKVTEWCSELKVLSEFAKSQPPAAYAAFCFGEETNFNYFLRTIPEMNDLMKLCKSFHYQQFLVRELLKNKENYHCTKNEVFH